jgi:hypothetical protein
MIKATSFKNHPERPPELCPPPKPIGLDPVPPPPPTLLVAAWHMTQGLLCTKPGSWTKEPLYIGDVHRWIWFDCTSETSRPACALIENCALDEESDGRWWKIVQTNWTQRSLILPLQGFGLGPIQFGQLACWLGIGSLFSLILLHIPEAAHKGTFAFLKKFKYLSRRLQQQSLGILGLFQWPPNSMDNAINSPIAEHLIQGSISWNVHLMIIDINVAQFNFGQLICHHVAHNTIVVERGWLVLLNFVNSPWSLSAPPASKLVQDYWCYFHRNDPWLEGWFILQRKRKVTPKIDHKTVAKVSLLSRCTIISCRTWVEIDHRTLLG